MTSSPNTGTTGYHLLTPYGTILAYDEELQDYVHVGLNGALPLGIVLIQISPLLHGPAVGMEAVAFSGAVLRGRFHVVAGSPGRVVHLKGVTHYLSADPCGIATCTGPEPRDWERFLLLPAGELADLTYLQRQDWLDVAGRCLIAGASIRFANDFGLVFGQTRLDLTKGSIVAGRSAETANDTENLFSSFILLRDGWKIGGEFRAFRPLVYYAAFGAQDAFEQLRLSLHSLVVFGRYRGAVHVISDRPIDHVQSFVPAELHGNLTVQRLEAGDYLNYSFTRYSITQWRPASSFQPILYIDSDIVIDCPLEPFLIKTALSASLLVVLEPSSRLHGDSSVGAMLFERDGGVADDLAGVNSGCIGIPDLPAFARHFALVGEIARGYRAANGLLALGFSDQAIFNYIVHRIMPIDPGPLSAVTRVGPLDQPYADHQPVGMVHFWMARQQGTKADAMARYIEHLHLQAARQVPAADPCPPGLR